MLTGIIKKVDWLLLFFTLPIMFAGLVTMKSFDGGPSLFFNHQIIWIIVSVIIFILFSVIDFRFIRRTSVLIGLYLFFLLSLFLLMIFGHVAGGARSWFSFGGFSFQPTDMIKLVVILILAKYFSRRHVEIAHYKHILISALYAVVPFILVFLQPDFGSAMIIFLIWIGMVLVSGISKKHLFFVFLAGVLAFMALWFFVFQPYQKARIINFIDPYTNIHGSGYNAIQSTIAVGSGQFFGKGVGFGTQSRLKFLPEYETDFIFAAFAEEWGFFGVMLLLILYILIIGRIMNLASRGSTNFEVLFGLGVIIFFVSHMVINIGMNIGILPVTGITLPFMSYGGSHLLAEFMALGIISSMRNYSRVSHPDDMKNEFLGL